MKTTIWTLTACTVLAAPAASLWQEPETEATLAEIFGQEPTARESVPLLADIPAVGTLFRADAAAPAARATEIACEDVTPDDEQDKEAIDRALAYLARAQDVQAVKDAQAAFEAAKAQYRPRHSLYARALTKLRTAEQAAADRATALATAYAAQAAGDANVAKIQDSALRALGYAADTQDRVATDLEARVAAMQDEIAQLRAEREDLVRGLAERTRRADVDREARALAEVRRAPMAEEPALLREWLAAGAAPPAVQTPSESRRRTTVTTPRASVGPSSGPSGIPSGSVTVIVEQGDVHIYNGGSQLRLPPAQGTSWHATPAPNAGRVTQSRDAASAPSSGTFGVTWASPRAVRLPAPAPPREPDEPAEPRAPKAPRGSGLPPAAIEFDAPVFSPQPDFEVQFDFKSPEIEVTPFKVTPIEVPLFAPEDLEFTTSLGGHAPATFKVPAPDTSAAEPSEEDLLQEIARMVREMQTEIRALRDDVRGLQGQVRSAPRKSSGGVR